MKIKKFLILSFVLLVILLPGCKKENAVTDDNQAKTLKIELEENASTGYTWSHTLDDPGIIEVSSEYVELNKDEELVGAPGKRVYTITPTGEGKTKLECNLARSWEDTPIETKIYVIEVSKEGEELVAKIID